MPLAPVYKAINVHSTGEDLEQVLLPEEALQTFREGDPIYVNAAGNVAACAAPGALLSTAGNRPWGIAGDTAHNDAVAGTHSVRVIRIDGSARGIAPVTHATPALAITAKTQVALSYQLRLNPAGQVGGVSISLDNTANPVVQVERVTDDYPVGTQYGYEEFRWITGALQNA
jgi:hypothetical protein